MTLRPASARWFELLAPREDLTAVLEALAATGAVELQSHSETSAPLPFPELGEALEEYSDLDREFSAYWPRAVLRAGAHRSRPPARILLDAMQVLRDWCSEAGSIIRPLQSLLSERADLRVLESLVVEGADALPEGRLLAQAGPVLASAVFILPGDAWPKAVPAAVITQRIVVDGTVFLVAVGPAGELGRLRDSALALKGRQIGLPEWLPGDAAAAAQAIAARIAAIDDEIGAHRRSLDGLSQARDLATVLGDLQLMRWLADNVPAMPATDRFAWVTGWTSDVDGSRLAAAVQDAGIEHLLRFVEPPPGIEPPTLLSNPGWIRPFELFARLLGTPASGEADPTLIVAIVAPLLFGFMFGDIGQGAVILAAGLVLRRRYPALGILVAGGIMAMLFGLAFGSVFSREDLVPALWLHPLEEPMTVLGVSLLMGAGVLSIGLGLAAIQAHWTGQASAWWRGQAGVAAAYAGLVGALLDTRCLWLTLAGIAWVLLGGLLPSARPARPGMHVPECFETLFQLVINTVSFVRVGAFALAHAGLSAAVIGIAAGVETMAAKAFVLVIGNAFIIVLEGLVVGIQTTRLVLFEFFVRFLTATGRQFLPLSSPATELNPIEKETT